MGEYIPKLGCELNECVRCIFAIVDEYFRTKGLVGDAYYCVLTNERLYLKERREFDDIILVKQRVANKFYTFMDLEEFPNRRISSRCGVFREILTKDGRAVGVIKRFSSERKAIVDFLNSDWFKVLNRGLYFLLKKNRKYKRIMVEFYFDSDITVVFEGIKDDCDITSIEYSYDLYTDVWDSELRKGRVDRINIFYCFSVLSYVYAFLESKGNLMRGDIFGEVGSEFDFYKEDYYIFNKFFSGKKPEDFKDGESIFESVSRFLVFYKLLNS